MGIGVVIVVPAFTESKGGNPLVVSRRIAAVINNVSPAMGGGIHKPGDVIHNHQAQGNAP